MSIATEDIENNIELLCCLYLLLLRDEMHNKSYSLTLALSIYLKLLVYLLLDITRQRVEHRNCDVTAVQPYAACRVSGPVQTPGVNLVHFRIRICKALQNRLDIYSLAHIHRHLIRITRALYVLVAVCPTLLSKPVHSSTRRPRFLQLPFLFSILQIEPILTACTGKHSASFIEIFWGYGLLYNLG